MKKSKWDIIERDIDRDSQYFDEDFFYWEYYDVDYYDYSDDDDCVYGYLKDVNDKYISKLGLRVSFNNYQRRSYIDMMSFYSPGVLRQRKIDYLLGIDNFLFI